MTQVKDAQEAMRFTKVCVPAALLLSLIASVHSDTRSDVVVLDENSWVEALQDEWMVEFYAPWCPACKTLGPVWDKLAQWSKDSGEVEFKVAKVDVTENPGLSGRFLVLALPTIYHVKDGVFRQYRGPRLEDDLISFVEDRKWEDIDPVAWWKDPSSLHMGAIAWFFKTSMLIRKAHTSLIEDYGVPWWGSYAIFAGITVVTGLLLGLMLVFLCDCMFPPRPHSRRPKQPPPVGDEAEDLKYTKVERSTNTSDNHEGGQGDTNPDEKLEPNQDDNQDDSEMKTRKRRPKKAD